jgi:Na+:H+ antiporter, NhaA family
MSWENAVPLSAIRDFLRLEAAGGMLLAAASAIALVAANSPAGAAYAALLDARFAVQVGEFVLAKPLLLWINDGLMAIFFLLVGLEIKREILEGELSSIRQAALPGMAAVGGMVAPALIYAAFNWRDPATIGGWAIPAATDIAFALGVLALLGGRVPASLKIFLLALAIMDDFAAILIIALFYTADLSLLTLGLAGAALLALLLLNLTGVTRLAPYVLVGIFLWVCVLKSGVHATLAGVALAFTVPLRATDEHGEPPLRRMEHALHPWITYAILPLFAFANAGVSLAGLSLRSLFEPVPFGIALGLFLGKQVGVTGAIWLALRLGVGALPEGASWAQLYGVALITGIGFAMSLFIGTLALDATSYGAAIRIGVLAGSLLSAVAGYAVLRIAGSRRPRQAADNFGRRDSAAPASNPRTERSRHGLET